MRERINYILDCQELQRLILLHARYDLTLNEVQDFWEWYSELECAAWLMPTVLDLKEHRLWDLVDEWIVVLDRPDE